MMRNGNRLVELSPTEMDKIRELLDAEASAIDNGEISGGDWSVEDLMELSRRFETP